ncbi:hypothetical protein VTK26DRAFT_3328 [Humicola hyalothermophila]
MSHKPKEEGFDSGPEILRPIPRRPFNLNFTNPTPPEEVEDDDNDDDNGDNTDHRRPSPTPNISASDLRFLAPHQRSNNNTTTTTTTVQNAPGAESATPLSHTTSYLNLTSPTLVGIYTPSTTDPDYHAFSFSSPSPASSSSSAAAAAAVAGFPDPTSPLPEAPRPPGVDEQVYEVMRKRSGSGLALKLRRRRRRRRGGEEGEEGEGELGGLDGGVAVTGGAAAAAGVGQRRRRKREVVVALAVRAALLFALGVGYGVLVTRLPRESWRSSSSSSLPGGVGQRGQVQEQQQQQQQQQQKQQHSGEDGDGNVGDDGNNVEGGRVGGGFGWGYLIFWGVAGVALGSLLPWFDRVWEEAVRKRRRARSAGERLRNDGAAAAVSGRSLPPSPPDTPPVPPTPPPPPPDADWALVVRGIGAFVGIVFAIRKLPWASTMQLSLTLALANPFLWYLIDRSKPGFLLSAAVGLAGSVVLGSLGPDVMPSPMGLGGSSFSSMSGPSSSRFGTPRGGTNGGGGSGNEGARNASGTHQEWDLASFASSWGGLVPSQETIETSMWMLSVLFCSCVCFGNIGRRLALNSSAAGRGRWGGVR